MNIDSLIESLKQQHLIRSVSQSEGWGFATDQLISIELPDGTLIKTEIAERFQRLSIQLGARVYIQEKHWPLSRSVEAALSYAMEFGLRRTPDLAHCYELHYYECKLSEELLDSSKVTFQSAFEKLPVPLQDILKAREQQTAPEYARSAQVVCAN